MAIVRTDDKHYKAIADKLRSYGYTDTATPEEMPYFIEYVVENECVAANQSGKEMGFEEGKSAGYDEGYSNGYDTGMSQGYYSGKQAEYDEFWDNFSISTHSGIYMFAGGGWNDKTFKPPIGTVIKPWYPYMMFGGTGITDLPKICKERNITIDLSNATTLQYMFYNGSSSQIAHVGEIDTTNVAKLQYVFSGVQRLHTIDNLILREDGSQEFITAIENCPALENITITGKIGQNGFNVSKSTKLTHDSLMSIINALYDYSGTTTTRTVTLGTDNKNKLTEAEIAIATQKGWTVI